MYQGRRRASYSMSRSSSRGSGSLSVQVREADLVPHVSGRFALCCKDGPVFALDEVRW